MSEVWVKTSKPQTEQMFSGLLPESGSPIAAFHGLKGIVDIDAAFHGLKGIAGIDAAFHGLKEIVDIDAALHAV